MLLLPEVSVLAMDETDEDEEDGESFAECLFLEDFARAVMAIVEAKTKFCKRMGDYCGSKVRKVP